MIRTITIMSVYNLLKLVMESLATQKLVFKWTRNDGVEVKVAIHIGRDETVVALEEFADFDFGQVTFVVRA